MGFCMPASREVINDFGLHYVTWGGLFMALATSSCVAVAFVERITVARLGCHIHQAGILVGIVDDKVIRFLDLLGT